MTRERSVYRAHLSLGSTRGAPVVPRTPIQIVPQYRLIANRAECLVYRTLSFRHTPCIASESNLTRSMRRDTADGKFLNALHSSDDSVRQRIGASPASQFTAAINDHFLPAGRLSWPLVFNRPARQQFQSIWLQRSREFHKSSRWPLGGLYRASLRGPVCCLAPWRLSIAAPSRFRGPNLVRTSATAR